MWNDEDWMEEFERIRKEPFVMVRHKGLYFPAPLSKGDKIGIVSLSGYNPEEVLEAMGIIASYGYVPVLSDTIKNLDISSEIIPRGDRILDLHQMIEDPEIKAIFCCGDGSGCIEILPNFSYGPIARNPKWLVGHDDVTALISMWLVSDIAPIHGPMCSDLKSEGPGVKALFNLLSEGKMDYMLPVSTLDRKGKATGRLIGGNLGVISMLGGTTYDMVSRYLHPGEEEEGVILFFEASEIPLGKVRDMLIALHLSGTLLLVKGIIWGSFRDCEPTGNLHSILDVVKELEERMIISPEIPIVFDFPIGAGTPNLPLIVGQKVDLEVDEELISLRSSQS